MIQYDPYFLLELRKRLGGVVLQSILGNQAQVNKTSDGTWVWFGIGDKGYAKDIRDVDKFQDFRIETDHRYVLIIKTEIASTDAQASTVYLFTKDSQYQPTSTIAGIRKDGFLIYEFQAFSTVDVQKLTLNNNNHLWNDDDLQPESYTLIDLTKAKIDDLTANQVFGLLTLDGTDYSNLERLASGEKIKLNEFASQETNSVDLGTLNWFYLSPFNFYAILPNDFKTFGDLSLNGYETISGSRTDLKDKQITSNGGNGGSIWLRNDSYSQDQDGANQLKQDLNGVKITYELANKNNIAGSKYGFIDLGDFDWNYDSNNKRFSTGNYSIARNMKTMINNDTMPNFYCDLYNSVSITNFDANKIDMSIRGHTTLNGYMFIRDTRYTNTIDFKNSLRGKYLIYELQKPLGNKLDKYTAEQVYYMFFSTIERAKKQVPTGVMLESASGVILETKYGIVNVGQIADIRFDSNLSRFRLYPENMWKNISIYDTANVYLRDYESTSSDVGTAKDKSIATYINGWIQIVDKSIESIDEFRNVMNGKFLIYELETPVGTKYNNLTAKQIYNLINTDQIDLLSKGKTANGVRSLTGEWNNPNATDTSPYPTFAGFYITKGGCSTGYSDMTDMLNLQIITNHVYFLYVEFKDELKDERKQENYNALFITNENYEHICSEQWYMYQEKNFIATIVNGLVNDTGVALSYYSNGGVVNKDEMIPTKAIVVDLTENGLNFIANHDKYEKIKCYNYFKENNLRTLVEETEIERGGYIK